MQQRISDSSAVGGGLALALIAYDGHTLWVYVCTMCDLVDANVTDRQALLHEIDPRPSILSTATTG